MNYPANYRYNKSHQWVLREGQTASVGITEYAQDTLGDIKFVELPNVGQAIQPDTPLGSIQSVKSVSDVFSPVTGEVADQRSAEDEARVAQAKCQRHLDHQSCRESRYGW